MKKIIEIYLKYLKNNALVFTIYYDDNTNDDFGIQNYKEVKNISEYLNDQRKPEEEREGIELEYKYTNLFTDYFGSINWNIEKDDNGMYMFKNESIRSQFKDQCIKYLLDTQKKFKKIQNTTKFYIIKE